jgi:hypothetical protein
MNALCAMDPKAQTSAKFSLDASEESWSLQKHTIRYWPLQCMSYTNYTNPNFGWLPWFWICSSVPLKGDLQTPVCVSEYHDDDISLIPSKDARSDDYALGTWSSEEC